MTQKSIINDNFDFIVMKHNNNKKEKNIDKKESIIGRSTKYRGVAKNGCGW